MTHPTKAELLRICNESIARGKPSAETDIEHMARALKALLTTPPESKLREALQHIHHIAVVLNRYVEQPPSDMLDIERIADKALSTQPQDREGWQWVPKKMAPEMKLAAFNKLCEIKRERHGPLNGTIHPDFMQAYNEEHEAIYEAALAAAPQPPEQSAQGRDVEMFLCETERVILKPEQRYVFRVDPNCSRCKELAVIGNPQPTREREGG